MHFPTIGSRNHVLWLLLPILVSICFGVAAAQEQVSVADAENGTRWFVELTNPPTADGGSLAAVRSDKKAFRQAAASAGLKYRELRSFDVLFNGLSVEIAPRDVAKLSQLSGVKAVYPVVRVYTDDASAPDLFTAIQMTGADIAQNTLGFTGAGVKVGVIDTGIDYTHPDLGGCFGAGCRVVGGWDFVGDAYDSSTNPVPVPDPDPKDCAGHGTHVSGIIGANGVVKGVAPEVTFYAYRVFGCSGTTDSDIMIAAMERALADGVQVINMSIGSAYQWPQYPSAAAATRLVNKGVVVVASIGNNGANGLYAAGAPGVGAKVIGVASYNNIAVTQPAFSISPDNMLIGYNAATAAPAPPTSGSWPMARTGTTTTANDACNPLAAGSLSGKVALIRRGTCSFYQKAFNAQSAGAAGVVLYNNTTGFVSPTVAGSPAITIPVVMATATAGALIDGRIASGGVTMTWTNQTTVTPDTSLTAGYISDFSSYGLSPDLSLKPDLGAPGGNIYSTYPVVLGSYAVLSGTSMSSPHVAGTVALLLQAKPRTSSQDVRSILQNSAVPKNWWGNPGLGFLDNVQRQGAGMVRIDKAILSNVMIEPGKLSLGENLGTPVTNTLTLRNSGPDAMTYNLSQVAALATGPNTFAPSFYPDRATAQFSQGGVPVTSVTVFPYSTATVDVTINPDISLLYRSLFGGYLVFTADTQTLRVPYAGFYGDYQGFGVMTPTAYGFPWLAQLVGSSYYKVGAGGTTYTMAASDVPFLLLHLDHQARRLKAEAFDAVSGKSYHVVFNYEYLGRNSGANSFFAFSWDGTTVAGNKMYTVPNGNYVLKLTLEKALADGTGATDYEYWTSPAFTIQRP